MLPPPIYAYEFFGFHQKSDNTPIGKPDPFLCLRVERAAKLFIVAAKTTGKRAAGYIRLSVMTDDSYSPTTQKDDILKWCKKEGWVKDFTKTYRHRINESGASSVSKKLKS